MQPKTRKSNSFCANIWQAYEPPAFEKQDLVAFDDMHNEYPPVVTEDLPAWNAPLYKYQGEKFETNSEFHAIGNNRDNDMDDDDLFMDNLNSRDNYSMSVRLPYDNQYIDNCASSASFHSGVPPTKMVA